MITHPYNRETFLPFLRNFIEDVSIQVERLDTEKCQYTDEAYRLGHDKELDLEVYEIHHTSTNDARVGIAKDAFKLLFTESLSNRALVVFVPEGSNQWRLSLLQIEAEVNAKGRVEKTYSNPRRHSYLLGEGGSLNTPKKYLIDLGRIRERKDGNKKLSPWEDLQSRFSVEALTKEFYNKLYNWYLWAVEPSTGVTFPNLVNTSKDDRDDIAIKIIRLITRLLFVWFIKQKKLVPTEIFDETELNKILANFDPQSEKDGKYYNAILQNLFFATLNNEIDKRRFMSEPFQGKSTSFGVKTLFRDSNKASWFKIKPEEVIELFRKVPFMNCGLFECLDKYAKSDLGVENDLFLDGFSSRDSKQDGHYKYRAFIPNRLFFAEEHMENVTVEDKGQKKTDTISVMGLINLLKLYNFTVQENTPSEVEVSLDPELLGQVFENLLAAYNPETKESARKSTGSFYTPRPIVEYMVNESLIAYLKTKVPSVEEDTWRALISYEDKSFALTEDQRTATLNALYECKILDPACGSGAFPMGMLQQMVHITRKLDSEFDPYQTKLRIINNCIYGSDIQPIAMLISKLRFFISLICEQDESRINYSDPDNNYGIDTLPNLETKFVAANSLLRADIHNYADDDWTQDPVLIKLKNDLLAIRKSHFSVRTQTTKLKKREEDRLKREEIQNYILQSTTQPDPIKIQMYEARINHLNAERDLYEGEKIVEEIVDTQASLFDEAQPQVVRKDINKIHRDRIDAEIKGLQQAIAKEQNKRNPVGFNAAIQQITDWNPYDQLKHAPFFDPDWMFGITDGFDIVIGNPPYIRVQNLEHDMIDLYKSLFKTAYKRLDISTLFMEQMSKYLSNAGVLCYISANQFTSAEYGRLMRKFLIENHLLTRIIDFADLPVFENAITYVSIFTLDRSSKTTFDYYRVPEMPFVAPTQYNTCLYSDYTEEPWSFVFDSKKSVLKKIASYPLLTEIAFAKGGIISGNDDCYLFSSNEFPAEEEISLDLIRTDEIGRYYMGVPKLKVFYPCKLDSNGDTVVMELDDIKRKYPLAYQHITSNAALMKNRKDSRNTMGDKNYWYQPVRFGTLKLFDGEKILSPGIVCKNKFTIDEHGYAFSFGNMYAIVAKDTNIQMRVLLGILNSKLIEFYLHCIAPVKQGGYFSYGATVLEKIPIVYPQKNMEKEVRHIVDSIIAKKEQNPQADTTDLENQIDILVYLLYKLTYDEVRIIDPNIETIISKAEYNKRLAENA